MTAVLPAADRVRSIACLMLGGIGDMLVTTPALHALRRRYPGARLTLILRQAGRDLAQGHPDIDEVVGFPAGVARQLLFLARLVGRRWDLWVDLHVPTFNTVTSNARVFRRNDLMMRLAGNRFRVGFGGPSLQRRLTHPVEIPDAAVLRRENIALTTLRLAGGGDAPRKRLPPVSAAVRDAVERMLAERGAQSGRRVGLFLGSRQDSDVWPYAQVRGLCAGLVEALPDTAFLLLGGPREHGAAARLRADLGATMFPPFADLTGAASLAQTAALLQGCAAVISTDSGPMHMADALRVPLVALFGSKNHPAIWAPLSQPHVVLNHSVPCGPCFRAVCDRDNLCMALIRPEEVIAALRGLLEAA